LFKTFLVLTLRALALRSSDQNCSRQFCRTLDTLLTYTHFPGVLVIPDILSFTPSGPSALRYDVLIRSRRISQLLGHLSGCIADFIS